MTTAERIQKWRSWAGLTQASVAKELGITAAAVSYWETGASTPKQSNLEGFTELLGISMERFYGPVPRPLPRPSENRT